MTHATLQPGQGFPTVSVPQLGGGTLDLTKPEQGYDRRLLIVYRGKHCPLCTRYLHELNQLLPDFHALGIEVVAVSADSQVRTQAHMSEVRPEFPVGYDLSIEQMQTLGLYISHPRLGMDAERPFAEPGLFVINGDGTLQLIDISNVPFARPDLKSIHMGLNFLRNLKGTFPINGTYT